MPNVLVIDDDRALLETLRDILEDEGLRIVCATTAAQGLESSKTEPFQAVLLDLKLPDRDGLDVLRELIESDSGQKVIVITGYATIDNAIRALNEGASSYITKPFNIEELKVLIKQAMAQRELASEKKRAEEEVRSLKEFCENILSSLPYAIVIFNQLRMVEYVNPVYLKDFTLEKEKVIGRQLFEILPLSYSQKERMKRDVDHFLLGKEVEPCELKIDHRTFGCRLFYVLKGALESQKAGLIMRDITMELKIQQQLIQSEKLAGIGTMAMGIAHEINNPLFGIMGMAEAVLDEDNPNLIKEYCNDIIKYSKHASAIVRGLTMYSRSTESGELVLNDVNDKFNEAIKIVRHSVQFDGIEVVKEYKAEKKIMINSGELQQIMVNIIHNAAQAMKGNGRLLLTTRDQDDSIVLSISDSGPGISKEHLGRIFDPFFTTKDPDKGTGLGLNIVYRIVQKYNGVINVESEEGKGATFTITFPVGA